MTFREKNFIKKVTICLLLALHCPIMKLRRSCLSYHSIHSSNKSTLMSLLYYFYSILQYFACFSFKFLSPHLAYLSYVGRGRGEEGRCVLVITHLWWWDRHHSKFVKSKKHQHILYSHGIQINAVIINYMELVHNSSCMQ